MRVEDELRGAFGEIVGGPVPVRVEPGDVDRAVRTLRTRRAAGAGAALVAVGVLAGAGTLLRAAPPDPVATAPVSPPVEVVVSHRSGRIAVLATPGGPEHVLQDAGPELELAGHTPFGVMGVHDGWLVRVSASGVVRTVRAEAWARGADVPTPRVWAVRRAGGRLVATPVSARLAGGAAGGTVAGNPVTLPEAASMLAGEVPDGLVVEVERPPRAGDTRDDVFTVPTTVPDVVLVDPTSGVVKRVLAYNALAGHVSAGFVVVNRQDPCTTRGHCPDAYRLEVRTDARRDLAEVPEASTRAYHQLSRDGRYAATLASTDRGDLSTDTASYRLWLEDLERGVAGWVGEARSVGMSGGVEWTADGTLLYAFWRDGKTYVAWYRPGMPEPVIGSHPLTRRSRVDGALG